jgi:hypothetical protein
MSLDGPAWQVLGAVANIMGVTGAVTTVVLGTAGGLGFVARDGILVPLYLHGAEKHLTSAKSVINGLSDEQKMKIEELRQGTEQTLSSIIEQYEKCVQEISPMALCLSLFLRF